MNHNFESMTRIRSHFQESAELAQQLLRDVSFLESTEAGAQLIVQALSKGGKVLTCGNGGSMCDAMHFAEEMSGRYRDNRKPFAAIALSDPSALTCIGNDFGFEHVFAKENDHLSVYV